MNAAANITNPALAQLAHFFAAYAEANHTNVLMLAGTERDPGLTAIRLALASTLGRLVRMGEEGRKALPSDVREKAAAALRVMREARYAHPEGRFNKAKRFYLGDVERCECCNVRNPSRRWSNTENAHGRTAAHCALLFGVKVSLKRVKEMAAVIFPQ